MVYRRFVRAGVGIMMASLLAASCPSEPPPAKPIGVIEREMSPNTRRLYNFITDHYGQKIISGQMDTSWTNNLGEKGIDMIARVHTDTGKYPALKGFDLLELPNEWSGYGRQQIDEAVEWWEGKNNNESLLPEQPDIHGIAAFCWHWRVGQNSEFYTDRTDFRIPWKNNALDTASDHFKTIVNDLDKIAALLQILKDKDIPVLWRPLHEASGGWFWWGASGPNPYIALWEYMYNYLTVTKSLDNLLWVWNGQNAGWFPNPATVDIVGYDVYNGAKNYTSQKDKFAETAAMVAGSEGRVVALSENGSIPDPDKCLTDKAMWSWFMTWNDGSGSQQGETTASNFWTGEYHNTQSHKEKVYNHELVITLEELPDLTKYRLE